MPGFYRVVPACLPAKPSKELAIVHALEEELEDQERREIFIQDQRGALQLAEQRAEQRGEQRGEKRGELRGAEKGRLEGRLEVARRLIRKGMSRDEVAQLAGVDLKDLPED